MSKESKSWYRMTRPLFNSGYEDSEFFAYGQDGFQEVLDSFIGTDVLIYDKSIHKTPKRVRAIIQNVTSDVYNSTLIRQILCNIGELRCGQYVKVGDAYWLVAALPDNNRVYEKGVLWKCKYTLRFRSPLTGAIVEYPVHDVNSTQYGTGEQEHDHMTIGDVQHLIYIPYNEETIMIDNRFRFLADRNKQNPTAYRITQVDPLSYAVGDELDDGLIQWSVLETQFNERTDNRELMVADYYLDEAPETEIVPGETSVLRLEDVDGDQLLAVGESKQIRVICTDLLGEVLTGVAYNISFDDCGGAAVATDSGDGCITLTAANERGNVGKTVRLCVCSAELGAEAEIEVQIVNW